MIHGLIGGKKQGWNVAKVCIYKGGKGLFKKTRSLGNNS